MSDEGLARSPSQLFSVATGLAPMKMEDFLTSTETPRNFCPTCHKKFDRVSGGREARENDFSVCFRCGSILRLNRDLTCRLLTSQDEHDLMNLPEITRRQLHCLQAAIRARSLMS